MYDENIFNASMELPLPTGKLIGKDYVPTFSNDDVDILMEKLILDFYDVEKGISLNWIAEKYNVKLTDNDDTNKEILKIRVLTDILNRLKEVNGIYLSSGFKLTGRIINLINKHNSFESSAEGLKNYTTYLMHKVLNDLKNAITAYKSIDVATDAFDIPLADVQLDPTNNDDGHSKSMNTVRGATGKDGVGIAANGTKALFTTLNYYNVIFTEDEPLTVKELTKNHYFNIRRFKLKYAQDGEVKTWKVNLGPISDAVMTDGAIKLYQDLLAGDEKLHTYNRDASQSVGALLSEAADNAKKLNLDKLNAGQDYFSMHIFLAMMGCPSDVIILYSRTNPSFRYLRESILNDLTKNPKGEINIKLFKDLKNKLGSDIFNFERRKKLLEDKLDLSKKESDELNVIKSRLIFLQGALDGMDDLKQLYCCARELTSLARLLSINQGIDVGEIDIINQVRLIKLAYSNAFSLKGIYSNLEKFPEHYSDEGKKIIKRLVLEGDLNEDIVIQRMKDANSAIELYNSRHSKKILLNTEFDLNLFLKDPEYAEVIKKIYDVLKFNFNIFDIIDKVPHFRLMFEYYNSLIEINSKASKVFSFMNNGAYRIYNPDVIANSDFKIPNSIKKSDIKNVKTAFMNTVFEEFVKKLGLDFSYEYRDSNGILDSKFNKEHFILNFMTFMSTVIIPKLKSKYPDNAFLLKYRINYLASDLNRNNLYFATLNMRTRQRESLLGLAEVEKIKDDFELIRDIRISDLFDNGEFKATGNNPNMTIGDFLFLYSKFAKVAYPSGRSIDSVFERFGTGDIETRYVKFITDVDTGKLKIQITPYLLAAYIVKPLALRRSVDKVIRFNEVKTIPVPVPLNLVLQQIIDGKVVQTRYTMSFDGQILVKDESKNTDLIVNGFQSGKAKVTKVDENCNVI